MLSLDKVSASDSPTRKRSRIATNAIARRTKTRWPNCGRSTRPSANISAATKFNTSSSRRWTAFPSAFIIATANLRSASRAATARKATTSPQISKRFVAFRWNFNVAQASRLPHQNKAATGEMPALHCSKCEGEAYMTTKEFDALNVKIAAAGEKTLPNARNGTAGTLKQLDPKLVAQRPIRAVFYATGAVDGIEFKTHSEMLETLAKFGLPTQKLWWVSRRHRGGFENLRGQSCRALRRRQRFATSIALRD